MSLFRDKIQALFIYVVNRLRQLSPIKKQWFRRMFKRFTRLRYYQFNREREIMEARIRDREKLEHINMSLRRKLVYGMLVYAFLLLLNLNRSNRPGDGGEKVQKQYRGFIQGEPLGLTAPERLPSPTFDLVSSPTKHHRSAPTRRRSSKPSDSRPQSARPSDIQKIPIDSTSSSELRLIDDKSLPILRRLNQGRSDPFHSIDLNEGPSQPLRIDSDEESPPPHIGCSNYNLPSPEQLREDVANSISMEL